MRFAGSDYQAMRDDLRLTGQLLRIWECVKGGAWWTLGGLSVATRDPEPSISAQLRHLRKARFGQHTVEKRHVSDGLFEYRVIANNAKLVR